MSEGEDGIRPRRTPSAATRSQLSRSTPDRIEVRGFDLAGDLMGKVNLGDMAFLELKGRLPTEAESIVFNAMLVALVEHGITPNTIAARLTYLGAPEALQGAVAAGLLGLGSVFVGTIEGAARILQESLTAETPDVDLAGIAERIVQEHRERRQVIPGLGHPIHREVDPRTTRLFALADEHAVSGRHVHLMQLIGVEVARQSGRRLPINVTGAIGAIAGDMDIPWQICRGLGIMARSIGLVAHILEEMQNPMAAEIWRLVEDETQDSRISTLPPT
jgi:citrate synthase